MRFTKEPSGLLWRFGGSHQSISRFSIQFSSIFNNHCSVRRLLPPVVCKGLVRLRHLVRVFALLAGVAAVVRGVEELGGELLLHGLLTAIAGVGDQPAHAERLGPLGTDVDR